MRYLKDVGFVIRRINIGEADKYVTLFTKNNGKIETLAKGVRKITSRRASHIELLNLIEFQTVQSTRTLVLTEVKLLSSCQCMKTDLGIIPSLFLLCELVDKLCPEGQKHEDIFNLLFQTIKKINEGAGRDVIYEFQIQLLTILGFWDRKKSFNTQEDLSAFIEGIMEKKIKTRTVFKI